MPLDKIIEEELENIEKELEQVYNKAKKLFKETDDDSLFLFLVSLKNSIIELKKIKEKKKEKII